MSTRSGSMYGAAQGAVTLTANGTTAVISAVSGRRLAITRLAITHTADFDGDVTVDSTATNVQIASFGKSAGGSGQVGTLDFGERGFALPLSEGLQVAVTSYTSGEAVVVALGHYII